MENSMKFQSITMNNSMRYKGRNVIEFSCDEKKNVTVVLGDNTVGKTTIAQAFRWGLYGAVLAERGKQQEDYQLLNNDILAMMDANSKADVTVELIAVDDEKRYQIKREIIYTRAYPRFVGGVAEHHSLVSGSANYSLKICHIIFCLMESDGMM